MISTEGATVAAPDLTTAAWVKSSFSGNNGDCVEAAALDDGRIAVRNSNHPSEGVVFIMDLISAADWSGPSATRCRFSAVMV